MIKRLKHYNWIFKDPKLMLIAALVIAAAAILMALSFKDKASFQIEDKCGQFVNVIGHTVQTQNACATRCRAQCISMGYSYKKVDFTASKNACNSCTCHCR